MPQTGQVLRLLLVALAMSFGFAWLSFRVKESAAMRTVRSALPD